MHLSVRHVQPAAAHVEGRAPPANRLLVIGASVRAAMASAVRAGITATGIDLFADADTRLLGPAVAVRQYPGELADRSLEVEACDWIYTGGVENYPDVVERISQRRRLLGVGPHELSQIRDPLRVSAALSARRVRCAALLGGDSPPTAGRWLVKHRRSSGGRRVARYTGTNIALPRDDWYFQTLVDGMPASAVFVAAGGKAALLGVTEQRIGRGFGAPYEFAYAGSVFPAQVMPRAVRRIERLGAAIAADFALGGLFGIDLVIDGLKVWPIEINPRYTASIEILERAGLPSAVGLHVEACRNGFPHDAGARRLKRSAAKQIVFANHPFVVTEEFTRGCFEMNRGLAWPVVADIPQPRSEISQFHPVVTVLADEATPGEVESSLAARVGDVHRLIEACAVMA